MNETTESFEITAPTPLPGGVVAMSAEHLSPSDLGLRVEFYNADGSVMLAGHLTSLSASFFSKKVSNVTVCVQNDGMHITTNVPPATPIAVVPS